MARLSPLTNENMTAEQRAVADAIRSGPRGGLRGPFEAWLRSPELCDRAQKLGEYCRFNTVLPAALREIAILLTGKRYRAQFEFWAHARLAREAGVPEEVIEAIRVGQRPPPGDPAEIAAYELLMEYFDTTRVSAIRYEEAVKALGERGVVDLVGLVGYYSLVSMTLNVFEVGLPAGEAELLE
jgi:4-carboxymuconolactone decarboxylase